MGGETKSCPFIEADTEKDIHHRHLRGLDMGDSFTMGLVQIISNKLTSGSVMSFLKKLPVLILSFLLALAVFDVT